MKLKELKEQPLLSPPGAEQSPWAEVTVEQVRRMPKQLHELMKSRNWEFFIHYARLMKTLGFDVMKEVQGHEQDVRQELQICPQKPEWRGFLEIAKDMRVLGLNVETEVKQHNTDIWKQLLSQIPQIGINYADFTPQAANMKILGMDMTQVAQEHETQIRELLRYYASEERWWEFTLYAVNMKALGLDVAQEVGKYQKQIREEIPELLKWDFKPFTRHIAAMLELGLLTPNPQEQTPPMPPIKRIGR